MYKLLNTCMDYKQNYALLIVLDYERLLLF